eukprot:242226-Rhodomonas_salina.1
MGRGVRERGNERSCDKRTRGRNTRCWFKAWLPICIPSPSCSTTVAQNVKTFSIQCLTPHPT